MYMTNHLINRALRPTRRENPPKMADQVEQATQLLTRYLHCRKESEGLQACHAQHGVGSEDCTRHLAAFTTCANASMMQIVDGLVKIADKFCAEEVAAYQRCKQQGFGDEACETLDLAALQAWRLLQHSSSTSAVPLFPLHSAPPVLRGSARAAGCSTPPAPRLAWSTRHSVRRNEPLQETASVSGGATPAGGAHGSGVQWQGWRRCRQWQRRLR